MTDEPSGTDKLAIDRPESEGRPTDVGRVSADLHQFASGVNNDHDPSKALTNSRHESFCKLVVSGDGQGSAYQQVVSRSIKRTTADTEASRLIRRPKVAARLLYLANLRQPDKEDDPELHVMASRRDVLLQRCRRIIEKTRSSDRDVLAAIALEAKLRRLYDVQPDDDRKSPDPAYLMKYIREAEAEGLCPVCKARSARGMDDDDDSDSDDSGEAASIAGQDAVPSPEDQPALDPAPVVVPHDVSPAGHQPDG